MYMKIIQLYLKAYIWLSCVVFLIRYHAQLCLHYLAVKYIDIGDIFVDQILY